LWQDYRDRNVQVLVIDVMETEEATRVYVERSRFSFPVLLDSDGEVSASFAPAGVLPDLPRDQVPIASNLIIDPEGEIQFYSLLDSANFDAKLIQLKARLDELLAQSDE
jgi:peroxiredoxin